MKKTGFVIVAAVLAAACLAANGASDTVLDSIIPQTPEGKIVKDLFGKKILDGLSKDVAATSWLSGPLSVGTYPPDTESALTDTDYYAALWVLQGKISAEKFISESRPSVAEGGEGKASAR